MVRALVFIIVVCCSIVLPWWLLLPLWIVYAFFYPALELIVLGVALDAFFGYMLPWHVFYTLSAALTCMVMEWLKPRMAFHETRVR